MLEEADAYFDGVHLYMQSDLESNCFRQHTCGDTWGLILRDLPEVRRHGIRAPINYHDIYVGPKDKRFIATMHLAYYRAKIYERMMSEPKFKQHYGLPQEIESCYSLHLTWHMRLRDKFDAVNGEKVVHTWMN